MKDFDLSLSMMNKIKSLNASRRPKVSNILQKSLEDSNRFQKLFRIKIMNNFKRYQKRSYKDPEESNTQ